MHARQQILHAVRDLLDAVVTPPWKGVYVSAIVPGTASMPAVLVRQQGESVGPVPTQGFIDGTRFWRTLSVSVQFVAKARTNPEDTTASLNEAAAAIEAALTHDALLGELANVKGVALQGAEVDEDLDASGYVGIAIEYSIEYMTADGAPEALAA